MSYKKCYASPLGKNKWKIHLWDEGGYDEVEWWNPAYIECSKEESTDKGINGEYLKKIYNWDKDNPNLHFHDMKPYQKFLIEKYGTDDTPSTGHRELFFDIECEIGGALTEEYIESAPMPITSIAWWDKTPDDWAILILDKKGQLNRTKARNKEIIPCKTEAELLAKFLERFKEIDPDILIGYNSDFFDIPYLYHRMCNVLGKEWADQLSVLGKVSSKKYDKYFFLQNQFVDIVGVESLDYMRLHKKYSWEDEPSWKLDAIGEKYVGINKIEYDGSLDRLFEEDIHKFIQYNFVDVEILVELDKKLQYLALTRNLAHKGKINYSEVYASSKIHDGALSAYLLSKKIIPPNRPSGVAISNYAGGYLFCPKAGLYKYMFDEDLTSLYPSIIMSLNIGRESVVGRIVDKTLPKNLLEYGPYKSDPSRNNYLGLNDLKNRDSNEILELQYLNDESIHSYVQKDSNGNPLRGEKGEYLWDTIIQKKKNVTVKDLINLIEKKDLAVAANGTLFRKDKKSLMSIILKKWFEERKKYKEKMKTAYKSGDNEKGSYYYLMQYTMKILLNSLYGATALPSFRYGMPLSILSEAITLSGWRIIQESALVANRHMNKVLRNEIKIKL
jgi:DNA polymerase elongation subunit (family B)